MKKLSLYTQRSMIGAIAICAIGLTGWYFLPSHAEIPENSEDNVNIIHTGQYLSIPEKSALRKTIVLETVNKGAVTSVFTLPASVEADPAKFVKVLTPLTGKIVSINKRLGDTVKAGEILFTVESPDFAQAQSDAKKARAALELARQNLSRQQDLSKSDLAARRDIEQAQNDLEQAASELTRANTRLAQLGTGATANSDSHSLTVRSPISGSVVDLNAAVGGYWNDATAPIMSVADVSTVFVTASAQEKDLSQLYAGQEAMISFDAYNNQIVKATVRDIGQILDTDTRTVKIRMSLNNPAGQFKPGMFATAKFETKSHDGITIPVTAVIQSGFYSRAFVEAKPWQFEPRIVKLGAQSGNRVEILEGIRAGERVVIKNGVLLND
jgi:cobalt-zinc-cadmium efflux system membrane fusion protein